MRKSTKFFPEVRERAVRLVSECRDDHPSQWAAVVSISGKIGCTAQTLLSWVRRHERNTGQRQGLTSAEQQRIKELEREVKELRKANEILKLASAFFALDVRPPFAKRSLHSGVNGKTAAHRSGLCRGHRLGP